MKRFNPGRPHNKGKRPMSWKNGPNYRNCDKPHVGPCTSEPLRCYGCREAGHKISNCPKAIWNQGQTMPGPGSRSVPTQAPCGRPPISGPPSKNSRKSQAGGRVYCIEAQEDFDFFWNLLNWLIIYFLRQMNFEPRKCDRIFQL